MSTSRVKPAEPDDFDGFPEACPCRKSNPCVSRSYPCPWRIRKSSQKRSGANSLVRCRHRATVHIDDSPAHTRPSTSCHHCQPPVPGRSTRRHQSLNGKTPGERSGQLPPAHTVLDHYAWRHHCRGLFQMPIAVVTNSPGTGH